jgi:hypothetical protein
MSTRNDELYSDEEAARRRDEALKRALNTPPKPHKPKAEKTAAKSAKKRASVRVGVVDWLGTVCGMRQVHRIGLQTSILTRLKR